MRIEWVQKIGHFSLDWERIFSLFSFKFHLTTLHGYLLHGFIATLYNSARCVYVSFSLCLYIQHTVYSQLHLGYKFYTLQIRICTVVCVCVCVYTCQNSYLSRRSLSLTREKIIMRNFKVDDSANYLDGNKSSFGKHHRFFFLLFHHPQKHKNKEAK